VQENIEKGAKREPRAAEFTVYENADSSPVGHAGVFGISHAHGTVTFGIAIGERRGHGLGTETTRLVLDFAFHVLQLRNVLLETLEWNAAGLTAYQRAGFRRVGVRRGAVMSRGRPTDLVIMDAVPEDFGASVLRRLRSGRWRLRSAVALSTARGSALNARVRSTRDLPLAETEARRAACSVSVLHRR
jgi:hypothetical protein